ncbi:seminase [Scaptodrosophila lebanonensis]|uniref:Seminase n=1 Tax=Drosophila lebanonensis TaxID=7225 RepID=A0A6J2T224_DROLE|nr:seminase [Scaptodrosophila lebanonensis]
MLTKPAHFLTLLPLLGSLFGVVSGVAEQLQPRVYGGELTTNRQMGGFMVQIIFDNELICTGSVISQWHIVTAAHCFEDLDVEKIFINAGDSTKKVETFGLSKIGIEKLWIHPTYNKLKFIGDIAGIQTNRALKGDEIGILPFCKKPLRAGDVVTVAGFGRHKDPGNFRKNFTSAQLRYIKVPIIAKGECNEKLRRKLPNNVLCATAYDNRTTCMGDSGGPLIFDNQLCGIATWTSKCGEGVRPDIFMKIWFYRNFLNNIIKQKV